MQGSDGLYRTQSKGYGDVEINRNFHRLSLTKDKKRKFSVVGEAYTQEDKSGLSRLRPYLSDNDYKNVSGWLRTDEERLLPKDMDKAVGILKHLQDNGIPYTVSKDKNIGQLKCDIANTKISIRLTDKASNALYIGRVYKDGHSLYFLNPKNKHDFTLDETLALIDYGIGGHPDRVNTHASSVSKKIGGPGVMGKDKKRVSFVKYDKNGNSTLKTFVGFGADKSFLNIKSSNNHSEAHRHFKNEIEAENFIKDAVESARNNFEKAVNIEYLKEEADLHKDEPDYVPILSGNKAIAPIQKTYWDVLCGRESLKKPTESIDDVYENLFAAMGLMDEDEIVERDSVKLASGDEVYFGSDYEAVKKHLQESIDITFGNYKSIDEIKENEEVTTFNPALVASFMDSSFGVYRNNDNLVAAMSKLGYSGNELLGDDFRTGVLKDRLLQFDNETSVPMKDLESPFMKSMFNTIKDTITETACEVKDEDILIDANGVVTYKAKQLLNEFENGDYLEVTGKIGQIFEPDKQGIVETKYNGSANKLFTPGFNAYIVPAEGEMSEKPLMERVRLRGLEQIMKQNITQSIRYDLMSNGEPVYDENEKLIGKSIGTTTNINNTYRGLYGTTYDVSINREKGESLKDAYIRQTELTHLPKEVLDARFETAKGLIHFSKDIAENATVAAEYFNNKKRENANNITAVYDLTNDNNANAYKLAGFNNMAITRNQCEGYTDPVLTGSGKNQGIIRYLGEGVTVNTDGSINKSDDENVRAPIVNTSPMRYRDYIPADRVQMVGSNYLSASGIAGVSERELSDGSKVTGVGVAQITLQGLTFDDGAVLSKDFAEEYGVVSEDGTIRPLQAGDKICDFAGNKSIVAKVIDRDMDLEEADKLGIRPSVELFKANPDLDIVQAPYSAVSRFNAASAKLLMENPKDLNLPNGEKLEGCLGFAPVIITHHTAHEHTKQYDDDDIAEGRGRKISAQLAWAFSAKDAVNIMDEVFSDNNSAVSNLREMLNVLGLDMDETGTLRTEYKEHEGEERYVFNLPSMEDINSDKDLDALFKDAVDVRGGVLEMPFEMKLPSGNTTQKLNSENSNYPDHDMYALPVMSSHLRSGQTFEDGTSQTHDYTNQYVKIFESAVKYMEAENSIELDEKEKELEKAKARNQAISSYSTITESIKMRKFNTKHNVMRDNLMSHRVPNSATAVWTPDTNLNINQIAMNEKMMKNLGLKEGDMTLIWRDPILRDYGVKYMEVKLDNNLTGIAVNPIIAVAFDGDFDGDSVGAHAPKRESSKKEALEKFSFEYNLLDTTKVRENGNFALMINDSMDIISAEYADEQRKQKAIENGEDYGMTLKERRMALEDKANELHRNNASFEERHKLMLEISDWSRDCLVNTCATEYVSYKDVQSHAQSLVNMVDHRAKGNHKKLASYFKYFGADFEKTDDGKIIPETMKDVGHTLAEKKDMEDTELATAIKSHGTGNAGTVSQRLVLFARNKGISKEHDKENALSAGLKLTYLSTQGILQAKHDPIQAKRLYDMVQDPIRNIWKGRKMKAVDYTNENGDTVRRWDVVRGYDNQPEQATKEEWVEMFLDMHEHKDGLDLKGSINPDHVRQVADALVDENGHMFDIEDDFTVYKNASCMDILAYRTKDAFDTLCMMAKDGRNVFEGEYNSMFAPKQIRDNMIAKENGKPLTAITSRDVGADYTVRLKDKDGTFSINTVKNNDYVNSVKSEAELHSLKLENEKLDESIDRDIINTVFEPTVFKGSNVVSLTEFNDIVDKNNNRLRNVNILKSDISKDVEKNSLFNYNEDMKDVQNVDDIKDVEKVEKVEKVEETEKIEDINKVKEDNSKQISFLETMYMDDSKVSNEMDGFNK